MLHGKFRILNPTEKNRKTLNLHIIVGDLWGGSLLGQSSHSCRLARRNTQIYQSLWLCAVCHGWAGLTIYARKNRNVVPSVPRFQWLPTTTRARFTSSRKTKLMVWMLSDSGPIPYCHTHTHTPTPTHPPTLHPPKRPRRVSAPRRQALRSLRSPCAAGSSRWHIASQLPERDYNRAQEISTRHAGKVASSAAKSFTLDARTYERPLRSAQSARQEANVANATIAGDKAISSYVSCYMCVCVCARCVWLH